MVQRTSEIEQRKLKLPLTFTVGSDGMAWDGFFELDGKKVSKIVVKSFDGEGYAICDLYKPIIKEKDETIKVFNLAATPNLIGTEFSKSSGRARTVGQYQYFERSDGSIYAEILGKRKRRIHLGTLRDRTSRISIILQTIGQHFQIGNEFDKKELAHLLPKRLTYGQTLKSTLDVLKIKGYLDRRETKFMGRPYERYSSTNKIHEAIPVGMLKWVSPKQAQNE